MSKKATNFLSKKATHCLLSCFFACVALLLSKFLLSKKATQAKKQQQQSNNAKKQCRVPSKEATKQKSNTKSSANKQQLAKKQRIAWATKQHEQKSNSKKATRAKKQKYRNFPLHIFLSILFLWTKLATFEKSKNNMLRRHLTHSNLSRTYIPWELLNRRPHP